MIIIAANALTYEEYKKRKAQEEQMNEAKKRKLNDDEQ